MGEETYVCLNCKAKMTIPKIRGNPFDVTRNCCEVCGYRSLWLIKSEVA